MIEDDGSYGDDIADLPPVRVFTTIDMRLMYADLVAKLAAHALPALDPEHRSPQPR
ncbi:hypothetical protein MIPYR_50229 [uncultured Microbacterium sp.]|uniref:Uncharacterized protein n=1 Tax=uncultured Microbacterium sp. TaxID=191216 RepID=A0A1Y5PDH3_9MICO|nr:hypothetical protein MIPYR_50229 [uncultured Microbacterium sp.]